MTPRPASYLRSALADPLAAAYRLTHRKEDLVIRQTAHLLQVSPQEVRHFFWEGSQEHGKLRMLRGNLAELPYLGWLGGTEALYAIVRTARPRVVIETGVAAGVSSTFILSALLVNGTGELWSVDLPDYERVYMSNLGMKPVAVLPEGKEPGYLVPASLRNRWHLVLGDSRERLPALVRSVGAVDLFLHDSEHTYEAMTFEFETVWPDIRPGGVLLSDDVGWNNAFRDFCKRHSLRPTYLWYTGMGGVRKSVA